MLDLSLLDGVTMGCALLRTWLQEVSFFVGVTVVGFGPSIASQHSSSEVVGKSWSLMAGSVLMSTSRLTLLEQVQDEGMSWLSQHVDMDPSGSVPLPLVTGDSILTVGCLSTFMVSSFEATGVMSLFDGDVVASSLKNI